MQVDRLLFLQLLHAERSCVPLALPLMLEQLADLDLRIIIENSLVEWKELEDEGYSGDEWEDTKRRIRKVFLIRRMQLAKHFIQTNVELEWMILASMQSRK
ncbi:hypothetical protein ACJX0J_010513, partial [Zea mays]